MEFKYPIVTFEDFFDPKKLNFIINFFLSCNGKLKDSIDNDSFKRYYIVPGTIMVYDTVTNDDDVEKKVTNGQYYPEEKELDLFDDYLFPLLDFKSDDYIEKVDKKLKDELPSPESKLYYIENLIDELTNLQNQKASISFYSSHSKLENKIDSIINNLESFLNQRKPASLNRNIDDKIKFDLSKKEVCLLFSRLSNAGFLSHSQSSEKDLGDLIEKHVMYYDNRSNTHINITKADGYLKKLRTEGRYATTSKKLDKLFKPKQ